MVVNLYSTLTLTLYLRTSLSGKQGGGDLRRYPERWCAETESHGASESRHKQPVTVDEVQSGDPNSGVCIKLLLTSVNQFITRKFLFSDFLG